MKTAKNRKAESDGKEKGSAAARFRPGNKGEGGAKAGMITKRMYWVIALLFLTVFIMFMLADAMTGLLTEDGRNPRADRAAAELGGSAVSGDELMVKKDSESGEWIRTPGFEKNASAAIVSVNPEGTECALLREWCVYRKLAFRIYDSYPEASEISDCELVLLAADSPPGEGELTYLKAYAQAGKEIYVTALPEVSLLRGNAGLRDFFGIDQVVQDDYPLAGLRLLEYFMLGGPREYRKGDDYGKGDEDILISAPWFSLRSGYLIFCQGISGDEGVSYMDLPPLMWRTRTGNGNVYVINTGLFRESKALLGVLTAFRSQRDSWDLYPVINARTVSLKDFPLLAEENTDVLMDAYSRTSLSLARDQLWPNIAMILQNYGKSWNFFLSVRLNYSENGYIDRDMLRFYRQETEKARGAMGLSTASVSNTPLSDILADDRSFLESGMPGYVFTAAYTPEEQLQDLSREIGKGLLEKISLVMTEEKPDRPLLSRLTDRAILVSFTDRGERHESLDDLKLVSLMTALGMTNQQIDMRDVFWPEGEQKEVWNEINRSWSSGVTYQNDFRQFESCSVYEMEDRVRTFLGMNYSAVCADGTHIRIEASGDENEKCFILRLNNQQLIASEGASCERLDASAWLVRVKGSEATLTIRQLHYAEGPEQTEDVFQR